MDIKDKYIALLEEKIEQMDLDKFRKKISELEQENARLKDSLNEYQLIEGATDCIWMEAGTPPKEKGTYYVADVLRLEWAYFEDGVWNLPNIKFWSKIPK